MRTSSSDFSVERALKTVQEKHNKRCAEAGRSKAGKEENTTPSLFCQSSTDGRTHSQAERCRNRHCGANLCDVHTEHWVCLAHCQYWVVVFLNFLLRFSVVLQICCCAFPGQFLMLFPLKNLNSSISFYVTKYILVRSGLITQ